MRYLSGLMCVLAFSFVFVGCGGSEDTPGTGGTGGTVDTSTVQGSVTTWEEVSQVVGGATVGVAWDGRQLWIETRYDKLQRPVFQWVHRGVNKILAEVTVYGEGHDEAEDRNLRGQVYQQYDGAGVVTSEEYDFKGNLQRSQRRLAKEFRQTPDWTPLFGAADIAAASVTRTSSKARLRSGRTAMCVSLNSSQIVRITRASPWPPPPQRAATPSPPPRLRRALMRVTTIRAPVAPSG